MSLQMQYMTRKTRFWHRNNAFSGLIYEHLASFYHIFKQILFRPRREVYFPLGVGKSWLGLLLVVVHNMVLTGLRSGCLHIKSLRKILCRSNVWTLDFLLILFDLFLNMHIILNGQYHDLWTMWTWYDGFVDFQMFINCNNVSLLNHILLFLLNEAA